MLSDVFVTLTVKCSVLLVIIVTLKCLVLLMVTVTLKSSVLLMVTLTKNVFSVPYNNCHFEVFSAPYGDCHSAPYCRSAVVMNVPGRRTASRQNDAAASHSCHFNTVLYPRSYSQCQLTLNPAIVTSQVLLPHSTIITKFSQSQHYLHCTSADLSTYI